MSEIVADCPRCGSSHVTFDLRSSTSVKLEHGWRSSYETFCVCRRCHRATTFILAEETLDVAKLVEQQGGLENLQANVNQLVSINGFVSLKDAAGIEPPEHLPAQVKAAFVEGATCLSVKCPNAAATMFRLCVDLATKELLPAEDIDGLNKKTRRDLGLRLPWLFAHNLLPPALQDLSQCIKEDGNDGAHAGTLTTDDAEDLLDFTNALLERLYTEPERLRLAQARRAERRTTPL